jgi:hypothetical protein
MTICLETNIQRFNGQAEDMVQVTTAPEGSTFHAVDTGAKYVFHDGGWAEDLRDIYVAEHV